MLHGYVPVACSKDMQHGYAVWTCSMDMQHKHQHENVTGTCNRDMRHIHAPWTCGMALRHGHEAWTQQPKHGPSVCSCSIDTQHRHEVQKFNTDIKHEQAALKSSRDMQQGPTVEACSIDMHIPYSRPMVFFC